MSIRSETLYELECDKCHQSTGFLWATEDEAREHAERALGWSTEAVTDLCDDCRT